jgi:hypothetical protein
MKAYSLGLEPFDAKKRCHQYIAKSSIIKGLTEYAKEHHINS